MSDGTSFTIDIPVTGQAGVDAASASVNTLAARLDTSSKAAVSSGSAISAAEASYKQAEASADKAAKALEKIGVAVEAQKGKLKAAADAGNDKGAQQAADKLYQLTQRQREAATQADLLKTKLMAEAAALDKVKTATTKVTEAGKDEEINFEGLSRGLGKLGGPLAEVGRKVAEVGAGFGKLSETLGAGGPYVAAAVLIVALIAGLAALAVAAAVATEKILEWSIGLSDANQKALLLSQGIARSVAGGTLLNEKVLQLTKTLPLTQEELQETAKKLADSGLRGAQLTAALEKAGIAAAKLKFGPDFRKEMLSLDEQSKVFHANLAETFGGLKTDKLLEALAKLVALFDSSTASGRAMKVVFESLFQPLIDWLANAGPKIERFFLQLEIWALKAMIAIKPYGSTILLVAEAIGVLALGLVIGLAAALLIVIAPFLILGALMVGLYLAGQWLAEGFASVGKSIASFFSNLNLADTGKAIIDGLVNGISAGGAAVLSALTGVVKGAVDGVKNLLGIHSPSKVFAEIGMNTGAGMAQGVDASAGGVQNSLESMVAPPAPGGKPGAPAAPSAGGKSLSNVVFNFYGVDGADDAIEQFRTTLTRVLEGDAAQLGAMAPAT